jgi:drug/metabolite transporter (DMT)-like permease
VLTSRVALLACTAATVAALGLPWRVPRRDIGPVALPGLLLVVGTIAYGVATTKGLVSVVSVLATLSPVVTVGLAVLVLGERLARRQQLGVAVALAGVVLLAAG